MSKILGESDLVKHPYKKTGYTKAHLEEFKKCADPISGPFYFMSNYLWVQHPTRGKILYQPYEYQIRLIDIYHNYRRSINLLPRQAGKSVTAAGYLLWLAMFNSDKTILIAAHKFQGSKEIMQRIRFAYESIPDYIRAGITEYNKQSLTFDNGSRISAETTTENTARGKSLSLLYVDELAFVRPSVAREFWTSCSMTLSTGGKAIITSTPNSDDDQFAELWNNANKTEDVNGITLPSGLGINGFKAFRAYWNEHPDRDEAWAAEQLEIIGPERYEREINCNFVIYDETLINPFVLNQLHGIEPIEVQGTIRWYTKPTKGNIYLVSLDPSIGTGGDPAAIQVFEASSRKQVAEWTHNRTPIEKQVNLLKEITTYLVSITEQNTDVYWSVESNTIGEASLVAIRNIGEENIPGIFLSEPAKLGQVKKYRQGFNTTNTNKLAACAKLKNLIESRKMEIYSKKLISELKTFVSVENTYRAKPGETDDLVTSLLTLIRMMEILKNYIPSMEEVREMNDSTMPLPFLMSTSSNILY
jgi:ribosomal protein L9